MSLKDAPAHVVLAVDLIQLLEANEIAADVAIPALEIVLRDYHNKALGQSKATPECQFASQLQTQKHKQ